MENVYQHYLPQCYLRNFTQNGKNLFIYDKIKKASFRNSVNNIAGTKDFYKIPAKYLTSLKDELFFEKEFFANKVEILYAAQLKALQVKANDWLDNKNKEKVISQEDKEILSILLAIQFLRMPNVKNQYSDALRKATKHRVDIIKSFIVSQRTEFKDAARSLKVQYDKEYNTVLHSQIYANEDIIGNIVKNLINKFWVFYVSSKSDLYTSDNPIIIKPHLQNQKPLSNGFGMRGAEVIFPITSSVILTIWDSNYFNEKENLSNSFNLITEKSKTEYNCLQYIWANRQVYSPNNDFKLISDLKTVNKGKEIFMKKPEILVNGK